MAPGLLDESAMDAALPTLDPVTVTAAKPQHSHFWEGSGFRFHDLIDAINPLQHLPIVSTIYRQITGDHPGNVAEIVGDTLFGGLVGLASGAVNVALKEATGKDVGDTVLGWFSGGDKKDDAPPSAPEAAPGVSPSAPPPPPPAPQIARLPPAPEKASAKRDADAGSSDSPASVTPNAPPPALRPLDPGRRFIPIDVSVRGIAAVRAASLSHAHAPVPLELPSGSTLDTGRAPVDFSAKMREGLDKYDAMLARRTGGLAGASVDEIH
jgi:hypothetical protein